jgi:hypothetical protein
VLDGAYLVGTEAPPPADRWTGAATGVAILISLSVGRASPIEVTGAAPREAKAVQSSHPRPGSVTENANCIRNTRWTMGR